MIGALAAGILIVNINLPNVIEMLCSVAIVWANLAYFLVTLPLLLTRLAPKASISHCRLAGRVFKRHGGTGAILRLTRISRWADGDCPSTRSRSLWGLFVVVNIGWPRTEIYGSGLWGRFAAARNARL